MRAVLENAVALTVANDVGRAVFANRQRGGSPQLVTIFVADVNHLTRAVADWIVRPRRDRVTSLAFWRDACGFSIAYRRDEERFAFLEQATIATEHAILRPRS